MYPRDPYLTKGAKRASMAVIWHPPAQDGSIAFVRLATCFGPRASVHPARFIRCQSRAAVGSVTGQMSSRPEEFHLQALPEPYVNLSIHTAPDVRPFP